MKRITRKSIRQKKMEEMQWDYMRPLEEIEAAEEEMFDKVWFIRNTIFVEGKKGKPVLVPRHEVGAGNVERIIDKYGVKNLVPENDFECGMLNGKLSALRWVLGSEWDFLDT